MRVLCVIVNYRTAGLVIDCLRSLAAELPAVAGTRVVVTDNLSGDDSVAKISAAIESNGWGEWAQLMALPKNGGFAYGNNEGIRPFLNGADKPDFVWLLNPDTIVRPGGLVKLLEFLEKNPKIGIA